MEVRKKFFIGIDGGKAGGITILDSNQDIIYCEPIPLVPSAKGEIYDIKKIYTLFKKYSPNLIGFEEAHPMFGSRLKAVFTNGELFGIMRSILVLGRFPFQIIKARTWQKEIFQGQTVRDTKKAGFEVCMNQWPKHDFTATERSKKMHDGCTDSALIALYILRLNIIKNEA